MEFHRFEYPEDPAHEEYRFWCKGCQKPHAIIVKWGPVMVTKRTSTLPPLEWEFNGKMDKPSFHPAIRFPGCHVYVSNGLLKYEKDCDHYLAEKIVPINGLKAVE